MALNVEVIFDVQSKELTKDLGALSKEFKQLGRQQGGVTQDTQQFGRQLRRLDNDVEEFTRDTRRATSQIDKFGDQARESLGGLRGLFDGLDLSGVFDGLLDGLKAALTGDIRGAFDGLAQAGSAAANSLVKAFNPLWLLLPQLARGLDDYRKSHRLLLPFLKRTTKAQQDVNDSLLTEAVLAGKMIQVVKDWAKHNDRTSQSMKDLNDDLVTLIPNQRKHVDLTDDAGEASVNALGKLAKFSGGMALLATATTAVVVALAALAAAVVVIAIPIAALKSWGDFTSQVAAFNRLTGGTFKQAEKMSRVFNSVGLDLNDTSEILAEFAQQQKNVIAAFPDMKWDNTDMSRNVEEVLVKLSTMKDASKRNALAFQFFGEEGAKQLLPLITNAEKLNTTLSATPWITEEDLAQVGKMNTAWNDIKTAVQGTMVKIGSEFAPFVTPVLQGLADFVTTKVAPALTNFFHDVITGFQTGSSEGGSFGTAVGEAFRNIWTWVKKAYYEIIVPFFEYLKKEMKDPDIQYLIHTILPELAKVIGVTLYGAIWLAVGAFKLFMETLEFISHAIQDIIHWLKDLVGWLKTAYDWVKNLIGKIGNIHLPGWMSGALGAIGFKATQKIMPYTPTVAPKSTTTAPTTNITIQGALDPYATARQIESLLGRQNARLRGKPSWA